MTDITVIRGNGDWIGQDIIEPLLATTESALARGQAELDNGTLANEERVTIPMTDVRLGELIEVNDQVLGIWRGKCTSVVHKVQIDDNGNLSGYTELTLRRPSSASN